MASKETGGYDPHSFDISMYNANIPDKSSRAEAICREVDALGHSITTNPKGANFAKITELKKELEALHSSLGGSGENLRARINVATQKLEKLDMLSEKILVQDKKGYHIDKKILKEEVNKLKQSPLFASDTVAKKGLFSKVKEKLKGKKSAATPAQAAPAQSSTRPAQAAPAQTSTRPAQAESTPNSVLDVTGQERQGQLSLSPGSHKIQLLHGNKGEETLEIKGPIHRFSGQFGNMEKPGACLIMEQDDFTLIRKTIHHGAFGGDFQILPGDKVLVWKIPADLRQIEGWASNEMTKNDVGTYPLINDGLDSGGDLARQSATKYRIDLPGTKDSVHHFESEGGQILAGFSTGNIFNNFNAPNRDVELPKVKVLLNTLKGLGVDAFLCNSSHHAIIFRISPSELAQKLQDNESGPAIKAALKEASKNTFDAETWAKNYIMVYGEGQNVG